MSTTTVARPAKQPKTPPVWRCQYCAMGHHRSCPRATIHNGVLWLCQCQAGQDEHHGAYCLHCKYDHPDEIHNWACIDSIACGVRRQQRNEANPLWRMIQRAKAHGAVERKAKKLRMETVLAEIDPHSDESIDRVHGLLDSIANLERKAPRRPKRSGPPKPRVGKCECCGEPTKGGRFIPGHDAKLASALKARVKLGGDDGNEAYAEMKARGWLKKLPAALVRREDLP